MDQHALATHFGTEGLKEPQPHATSTHWVSYNCYEGHKILSPNHGNEYLISIVLDAGSHESLSGVRVIIINKLDEADPQRAGYSTQTLRDLVDLGRLRGRRAQIAGRSINAQTYGDMLRKHRAGNSSLPSSTQVDNSEVPDMLTLVFELGIDSQSLISQRLRLYCTARVRGDPSHWPTYHGLVTPHLIAYDRIWSLPESKSSIMVYLDYGILSWSPPNHFVFRIAPFAAPLPTYEVRILPDPRRRKYSAPDLPPEIVKSIVDCAIESGAFDASWRSRLLSYALLRKSWLPALETFFERIGLDTASAYHYNLGDPKRIAASLRARPERGRLIKAYDEQFRLTYLRTHYIQHEPASNDGLGLMEIDDFHPGRMVITDQEGFDATNAACKGIIQAGFQSIETIEIEQDFFPVIQDVLLSMAGVTTATFCLDQRRDGPAIPSEYNSVSIREVQDTIQKWTNLRSLKVLNWHRNPQYQEGANPDQHQSRISPEYRIEKLLLICLSVSQPEDLTYFLNTSAPSSLQELKLKQTVMTNRTLHDFLLTVHSSLSYLELMGMTLRHEPSEPHAVETALPRLKALTTLKIVCTLPLKEPGFSCSLLAGPTIDPNEPSQGNDRPTRKRTLFLRGAPLAGDEAPSVLETSTWKRIKIIQYLNSQRTAEIANATREAAERRGIDLAWTSAPFSRV